jgi:predicted ATPase/DNA-binding SARP family transcriptional activator
MVDAELQFRILGPIEVTRKGSIIQLGGRRQRMLLALLSVQGGRVVTGDWLIDQMWQGDPPAGASTLPSYVSRLRTVLGGKSTIENSASGYRLDISPDQVDARQFERMVDEGRTALADGKARRAALRLRAALALWRGRPFGELGDEGALRDEAQRLEELRLLALEARIDADLAGDAGAELVDELEAVVRRYPYRERFWAQLMLALYRGQRQADALAVYQRARHVLNEEVGLEPGLALRELELAILRQDVPGVAPPEARHNLPAQASSFIGREAELDEIERLMDDTRLLTLTGVGGVGKTRLGLESAARLRPDLPDGVWFADLSGFAHGSRVAPGVALAMGLGEHAAVAVAGALAEHVRDRRLLIMLDNCEHVIEAAADLAERLLTAGAGVRILATSREALGVHGEVDYPVRPMAAPPVGSSPSGILASEAVRLFLGRARAARPHLPDDDQALATVARIARDLDGLPLAIELAAARAKALSLDEIANRLTDRFRFLVSWRRLSPARHRTLREAMDWSFELLTSEEQQLLAGLSVFAGSFTLDAVTRICVDGDEGRALGLIERLVAASLVVPEELDGGMHYRLLATVRDYAAGRLDETAAEQVRRAHAEYYLRLAERADLTADRRGTGQRVDLAVAAQDNLRGALAWAVERGAVSFGLELATSLERFWAIHDPREGLRWFAALLERSEAREIPPILRANALRAYGGAADISGEDDLAQALWNQSLAVFRELGDEAGQAVLLHRLAISAQRRGDLGRARELVDASHNIHERLANRWGMAQTLGTLGAIARDEGDYPRAVELLESSMELAREARVTWWVSGALAELANLSIAAGQLDDADRRARESLTLAEHMGDRAGRVFGVGLLARVAAERGQHEVARSLWAAVQAEDAGAPLGGWRRHREAYREHMLRLLPHATPGPDPLTTLDEATAIALASAPSGQSEVAGART